jgi:hypothetical protein
MVKYLRSSSYIRKPFVIYDFAPYLIWISLYIRKIFFSFLTVCSPFLFYWFIYSLLPHFSVSVSLSLHSILDEDWNQGQSDLGTFWNPFECDHSHSFLLFFRLFFSRKTKYKSTWNKKVLVNIKLALVYCSSTRYKNLNFSTMYWYVCGSYTTQHVE